MSNTVSRQQWVFKTIYLGAWNLVIESPFSSEKCQEESALRTPCQFGNQVVLQFWWSIITPNLSKWHKISGSSRKTVRLASAGTVGCKGSLVISLKLLQVLGWIIIYIAGKGKCSEKLSIDVTLNGLFQKKSTPPWWKAQFFDPPTPSTGISKTAWAPLHSGFPSSKTSPPIWISIKLLNTIMLIYTQCRRILLGT